MSSPSTPAQTHNWPTDDAEHLWGPWLTESRTTKYRTCVHPGCTVSETKEVPQV